MHEDSGSTIRYKWELDAVNAEHGARYVGEDSKELLASLFAMWLKDRVDVSDWAQAPRFGKIVHTYSHLSMSVVAVWLGIDQHVIYDEPAPGTSPWQFDGPDGDLLELDRIPSPPVPSHKRTRA